MGCTTFDFKAITTTTTFPQKTFLSDKKTNSLREKICYNKLYIFNILHELILMAGKSYWKKCTFNINFEWGSVFFSATTKVNATLIKCTDKALIALCAVSKIF
jgi:hypothetical protein